jgi:hypothetical protein
VPLPAGRDHAGSTRAGGPTTSADALSLLASWAATETPPADSTAAGAKTDPPQHRTDVLAPKGGALSQNPPSNELKMELIAPSPTAKAPDSAFTGDVYVNPIKK